MASEAASCLYPCKGGDRVNVVPNFARVCDSRAGLKPYLSAVDLYNEDAWNKELKAERKGDEVDDIVIWPGGAWIEAARTA